MNPSEKTPTLVFIPCFTAAVKDFLATVPTARQAVRA
jgi:hypothetical protein